MTRHAIIEIVAVDLSDNFMIHRATVWAGCR